MRDTLVQKKAPIEVTQGKLVCCSPKPFRCSVAMSELGWSTTFQHRSHFLCIADVPSLHTAKTSVSTTLTSVTFLAGHCEICPPHRWSTWRPADQRPSTWISCMVIFKIQEIHVDRRVVGWSAGRHVNHTCGGQISPWPARKVTDNHLNKPRAIEWSMPWRGRALDRVTKQKHRAKRQKMPPKCPKVVFSVRILLGRATHGPMPAQGETLEELSGPLVHTNFPRKRYGPMIGPYEFPPKFVWTNGTQSSLKVSVLTGIGPWSALPCFGQFLATFFGHFIDSPFIWAIQRFARDKTMPWRKPWCKLRILLISAELFHFFPQKGKI